MVGRAYLTSSTASRQAACHPIGTDGSLLTPIADYFSIPLKSRNAPSRSVWNIRRFALPLCDKLSAWRIACSPSGRHSGPLVASFSSSTTGRTLTPLDLWVGWMEESDIAG